MLTESNPFASLDIVVEVAAVVFTFPIFHLPTFLTNIIDQQQTTRNEKVQVHRDRITIRNQALSTPASTNAMSMLCLPIDPVAS